jgi:uncharacterized protein
MAHVHAINWFEIPVANFERAKKFYETIFGHHMKEHQSGNSRMAFFQYDMEEEGRGGAIVFDSEFYTPCDNGTLVYLNAEPSIDRVLDRVVAAGGEILQGKTPVAVNQDLGIWALIKDTEGNRVALHALK